MTSATNNTPALVSVIVPCYNQGRYLLDSVQSIIHQDFRNWECIIINDGSTDNTASIAKGIQQLDSRIRYLEQNNRGLSAARNRGIEESRGKYIQFLDADDIILPSKFSKQLEALKTSKVMALSYCRYFASFHGLNERIPSHWTDPKLSEAAPLTDLARRWETEMSLPCHCFLFDTRLLKNLDGPFDESLPNHEDWDCWMRVLAQRPRIFFEEEELVVYRIASGSMSRNADRMCAGFLAAINKQKQLHRNDPKMLRILNWKKWETKRRYGRLSPLGRAFVRLGRAVPTGLKGRIKRWAT